MFKTILLVGVGSFIGGISRYLVNVFVQKLYLTSFPLGTFLVNITGCLLIGFFFGLSEKGNLLKPEWLIFLTTGVCGGFTTFSSFSYESLSLLRGREFYFFNLNIILSLVLGLTATYIGLALVRFILK